MSIASCNRGLITPWDIQPGYWYDPRNYDGSNSIIANGTSLATVNDLGRSASTQAQATGATQPTLQNNVKNGNPVFRLSGSQWMSAPNNSINTYAGAMTMGIVFTTPNASSATPQRLFCKVNSYLFSISNNTLVMNLFGGGSYTLPGTTIQNNTWYYVLIRYNGSSATDFYVNGTKTTVSSAATMTSIAGDLYFCTRDGTQQYFTGDIGIAFNRFSALSDWAIEGLNFYLKNRFNI